MKANDFLNTLGVDTHYLWQRTLTAANVQTILAYTGIRHTREDGNPDTASLQALCDIHAALGSTFDVISWGGDMTDTLTFYHHLASCGALLATEGVNEPNNFGNFTYLGATCGHGGTYQGCAYWQRDLYSTIKADPQLSGYPVWAETEPGAEPDNMGLQFLTIPIGKGAAMPDGTKYADAMNLHNYVKCNGCGAPYDNVAWQAEAPNGKEGAFDGPDGEFLNSTFGQHFPAYPVSTNLPRVTTESGWDTASVSPDQQGKLLTNVYLSAASRGWSYTFVYQAKDDYDSFGMYDSSMNPKLAATYIHNLTRILGDTSSNFSATPLSYTISNEPSTVHDWLMQKSSGTYELAVWGDQVVGESVDVTVNLPRLTTVSIYDVTIGSSPVKAFNDVSSIPLTITDHAMILEFK
jgi:hypothetical protein